MWQDGTSGIRTPSRLDLQPLLRQFGAVSRDLASVRAVFRVEAPDARRILTRLVRAGYVRRDPDRPDERCWRRTARGDALADGAVWRPLSRARAERLLQAVLRRVEVVNAKPHFLCQVVAVGVCGEYLTDAPTVDTLELVVRLVPKRPPAGSADAVFRPDRALPYWRLQKLLPPYEWLHWRERHVELYLVSGHRHLVLHRLNGPRLLGQHVQMVFPRP